MSKGFTLVETLIAIAILVMAVTGAFAAAQNGLALTELSKNQTTAFYLAQEAVEYIRNLRDNNGLDGISWLHNIAEAGNPCALDNTCAIDVVNDNIVLCANKICPVLKLTNNGFYNLASGTNTIFTREIVISKESSSDDEVSITVTIRWSQGLIPETFVARENILNWQ